MGENNTDKILAFDTLFTTNTIQMLKVLITYLPPSTLKSFAVYIKLMELQYTLSFFQNHPDASLCGLPHENASDTGKLFEEIIPFCDSSQKEKFIQIKNMMQTFENMQEMMQMMQMMKDLFPEGTNPIDGDLGTMFSGLSGFADMFDSSNNSSNMDMSQIFDLLNHMNS